MKGKQYFNLSALALAIILVWSTCHLVSLQKNESDNIDTEVKHIIQTYIRKHRDKKSFTILTTAKINEDKYAPNTILGLMVKCTPERGHNALFFISLQVFIML